MFYLLVPSPDDCYSQGLGQAKARNFIQAHMWVVGTQPLGPCCTVFQAVNKELYQR